jgi:hypothetical protein
MTRRLWVERLSVAIPAAFALATRRVFAHNNTTAALGNGSARNVSKRALIKYSRLKAAYKVPRNPAKQAKHLATLSALLALTPDQQQQAAAVFSSAGSTRASLHRSLKTARQSLSQAIKNNDPAGIAQASALIANLKAQQVSNGATANAAFFVILTDDQRALLSQVQA